MKKPPVIRCGIIGYGYWGPNLVRIINALPNAEISIICDSDPDRLKVAGSRFSDVTLTADANSVLGNCDTEAIFIATPVSQHYTLALNALREGKHVFVEKPLASTSQEAEQLVEEADKRGLVLMVNHVFVFSSAVQKIKVLLDKDHLGKLLYYDSVRVNLGIFRSDVNVVWDLAVHDLSIMDFLLNKSPSSISATVVSHFDGYLENVAYLTCFFEDNLIAHINVNWLAPVKIRRALIGGINKMIVYDELEPDQKVKIFDKGVDLTPSNDGRMNMQLNYRAGDIWTPVIANNEALEVAIMHFLSCVHDGTRPLTDGLAGLRIIRILEAADRSARKSGQSVQIDS